MVSLVFHNSLILDSKVSFMGVPFRFLFLWLYQLKSKHTKFHFLLRKDITLVLLYLVSYGLKYQHGNVEKNVMFYSYI